MAVSAGAQSSTTITFPGFTPTAQTVSWFYCDGIDCYMITPFGTILGPDMGAVWILNPWTWAILFEYFPWADYL